MLTAKDQKTIDGIIADLVLTDDERQVLNNLMADGDYLALVKILDSYLQNELQREEQLIKLRERVAKIDEEAILAEQNEEQESLISDLTKAELLRMEAERTAQARVDEEYDRIIDEATDKFLDRINTTYRAIKVEAENRKLEDVRNQIKKQ